MYGHISSLIAVGACALSIQAGAAEIELVKKEGGVTVNVDGKLFTKYLTKSGAKPILWPVIGPTGAEMTRSFPMAEGKPTEKRDHQHHRSFWFTHGSVNGVSFWHEQNGAGEIKHREFVAIKSRPAPAITTRNDWIGPDGKKQCEDTRTLSFGAADDSRWIDFDIRLIASEGKVKFGDTKEGSFGLRTAGTMKVEAKLGGRIINSNGQADREAWGKAAAWVDYHGPVEGQTVGIAIMNHPSSFRFPTYWHVRTYGLFAANPFGLHDFKRDKSDGSHTLKKGESFLLRYRVLFHKGDEKAADIASAFATYKTGSEN